MKCIIVLPCFNEEKNVKPLIHSINEVLGPLLPYRIVAVNDGSLDRTGTVLKDLSSDYPIEIVEHYRNRGLAEALKTGLRTAIDFSSDHDVIVTMDSDNTHDPKYLVKMVEATEEADVVVGSRYTKHGAQVNTPFHRVFLSRVINIIVGTFLRIPVKDATSGYRCFKTAALRKAYKMFEKSLVESRGFEVSLELLLKLTLCKTSIKEVPIVLDYGRKRGLSKMKLFSTIKFYLTLFKKARTWQKKPRNRC